MTILFLCVLIAAAGVAAFEKPRISLKSSTPMTVQAEAAKQLVGRVLGDRFKSRFQFEPLNVGSKDNDEFELSNIEDGPQRIIRIRGSSGVAMASGFYW